MGLFDKFMDVMRLNSDDDDDDFYDDDYYDDESEQKDIAEIIIAKNRHGATNTVELQWVGQYTTFSNPDRIHGE